MKSQPKRPSAKLGELGEALACEELMRRGLRILARRHRTRFGELDIIAVDGETTVFVEVKARRGAGFGEAAASIPVWKRRRIGAMALDYLACTGRLGRPCRFDVVAIDGAGGRRPSIQVIEHAFDL
jgi:putative endonuclease